MSQQIKWVHNDGIIYLINERENTAGIIGNQTELIIPLSINHDSINYIIIAIFNQDFKSSEIKSIRFADDHKLNIIDQ